MERLQGSTGSRSRVVRGTVGDQRGGPGTGRGALSSAAARVLLQGRPTRLSAGGAGYAGAWPRGAGAVSAARLLGAASRLQVSGRVCRSAMGPRSEDSVAVVRT